MEKFKLKNSKNIFFEGPIIFHPNIFKDSRGYFLETWNQNNYEKYLGSNFKFVQDNQSFSKKGVLRGMHYQLQNMEQGKLVRCISGSIYDVIIDLRRDSKNFAIWGGVNLNSKICNQLWIPPGFAHGFLVLSDNATVEYKVTNYWSKKHERSILWCDEEIKIKWPLPKNEIKLSKKDSLANNFKEIKFKNDIFI